MTTRYVIYARQSKDEDATGDAVERQIEQCRAYAVARGWTEVGPALVDNDLSATSGRHRPGYERALGMMRGRVVDVVVVAALDRFVRRLADLESVVQLVEGSGCRIATVSGDLDLSTDAGRLVGRILASVAQAEVERKGARQRVANAQRRDRGVANWTRRPFGYTRARKGLDAPVEVVEAEAVAFRWCVAHVLAGGTLAAAVRHLDAEGLPTTAGRPWNVTSIRRVLLSPRYVGSQVEVVTDPDGGRRRTIATGVAGAWPPLITPETHDAIVEALADPSRRTQQGTTRKYWLSGAIECGVCGDRLYAAPMGVKGQRRMVYRCRTGHLARRLDDVDQVVEAVLLARLSQPDAAMLFAEAGDVQSLRARAAELRERRDALVAMLADGMLSALAVRDRATTLTIELRDVEDRLRSAAGHDPVVELVGAADVVEAWHATALSDRRAIVDRLVAVTLAPQGKGFAFDPGAVRIRWLR